MIELRCGHIPVKIFGPIETRNVEGVNRMTDTASPAPPKPRGNYLVGFPIFGIFAVALIAVWIAFLASAKEDFVGSGTCLIAASLGLGLFLNAIMRR